MTYGLNTALKWCEKCGKTRWGTMLGKVWVCATCGHREG